MDCGSCGRLVDPTLLFCPQCDELLQGGHGEPPLDLEANSFALIPGAARSIGPYRLYPLERRTRIDGRTPQRRPSHGKARLVEVTGPRELHLLVADVAWANGERDVHVVRRFKDSPSEFDQLVRRARLPIERRNRDDALCVLRQARYNGHDRVTLCAATAQQLSLGAGVPVLTVLRKEFKLSTWGTLGDLRLETGRSRHLLCGTFPWNDAMTPFAVHVLTRIAPTVRRFHTPGAAAAA